MSAINALGRTLPVSTDQTSTGLDWTQRPDSLKGYIQAAYRSLAAQSNSDWGYFNGLPCYTLCGVKQYELIKKIIQQALSTQKDFYFLDVGSGNFQWGKAVAEFIEKQTDLPKDIKVHLIGVRGERYFGDRVIETERCKIYNLGAFKVEDIFEEFKRSGFDLENKLDLVVSHWCFRHLVDPVGTLAQIYNLLRSKTGIAMLDGFYFLNEKEGGLDNYEENIKRITQLFLDMKAPFLTQSYDEGRALNHFMVQRPDETPCQLPMSYLGFISGVVGRQVGSGCVTRFRREPQPKDREGFVFASQGALYGDKKLYEWLRRNELLSQSNTLWKPLYKNESQEDPFLLHKILSKSSNSIRFEKHLKLDLDLDLIDIDESDSQGCTLLHLVIEKKLYNSFQLLLSRNPHLGLANANRHTPLHIAARVDREGEFIQALLKAGAQVDRDDLYSDTPLQCAIKANNRKAVDLLIGAGAKISRNNRRDLEKAAFGHGYTALHEAAMQNNEDSNLEALIGSGMDVNTKAFYWKTPLTCAIKAKNLKAVELLINAGAELSDEDRNKLEDALFTPLYERKVISLNLKEENILDLHHFIERGNCVVTHYDGKEPYIYTSKYRDDKKPKQTLYFNLNPQNAYLYSNSKEDWPNSLGTYQCKPYDPNKVKKGDSAGVFGFRFWY